LGFIEAPHFGQIFFKRGTGVLHLGQLKVSTLHGWQKGNCELAISSSQ